MLSHLVEALDERLAAGKTAEQACRGFGGALKELWAKVGDGVNR
jgi:hypothetical protein